jgi:predicted permease
MFRVREWLHRLVGTFGAGRRDVDLQEELRAHAEIAADEARKRDTPEALRHAAVRHGGVVQAMELQREQRGFAWVAALGRDLRYGSRSLLRDRGSVGLAVLALSLGIGATTVMFSVVRSVFIDAFPFPDATRVVHFFVHTNGKAVRSFPADEFALYRERNTVFTNVIGGDKSNVIYQWQGVPYSVESWYLDPQVSGLGVRPILGREPTEADGAEGAPPTFLISDRLWAERFNRDPSVLGMTLKLNGTTRTLIGVMPPRFLLSGADIFFPTTFTATMSAARIGRLANERPNLFTFAQLKPGVTKAQAAANIAVVARGIAAQFPDRYPSKDLNVTLQTMGDVHTPASTKDMVWILAGAVLMLLLIACSNVANLMLARATARETEFALRAGLGASRARLMMQLLAESVVLASVAAVFGAFLGYAGVEWVRVAAPRNGLPVEMGIRFSTQALLAALAVSMIVTLLSGLAPALRAARDDLQGRLVASGRGVGVGSGRGRLRMMLVAVQVTLAIVLLVGAGLMMRTFLAIQRVDLGFNPTNVIVAGVVVDRPFPREQRLLFMRQAVDRIRAIPGVETVSPALGAPLARRANSPVQIPGTVPAGKWTTALEAVGEEYFHAAGVPLAAGRLLSRGDVEAARAVIVVNRRFVQEFLAGTNPLGRMARLDAVGGNPAQEDPPLFEIVGVVGDTRNNGPRSESSPQAYLPYPWIPAAALFLARTNVDPHSVTHAVRREVAAVNPDVALERGTLVFEDTIHRVVFAAPQFAMGLMTAFAGVGLVLAAIGVFSVMAYTVSLQTRDIGVRMALGAEPGGVVRMLVAKGLWPIAIGSVLGVGAAYGLSRVMANQIYGVTATDPLTFAAVVAVLAVVGVTACVLPARRATRVDPLIALRSE